MKDRVFPASVGTLFSKEYVINLLSLSQRGTYLPQTYIVHEEMVVTGRVRSMRQLGPFIHRLCFGKDTYRLRRRNQHRREYTPLSSFSSWLRQTSLMYSVWDANEPTGPLPLTSHFFLTPESVNCCVMWCKLGQHYFLHNTSQSALVWRRKPSTTNTITSK